jgi:hypothetical protein
MVYKIFGLLAVFSAGMALGNYMLPSQMIHWSYLIIMLAGGFSGARIALGRI